MIALDSSILVAMMRQEAGWEAFLETIESEECLLGTPTLVETRAWCAFNLEGYSSPWLEEFVEGRNVSVIPFSREMADVASKAYITFGKPSRHPANLNFGDCMAYAVSTALRVPLLFKGDDFGRTDVMVHPSSIRT
jgi:ribonuclease VapC